MTSTGGPAHAQGTIDATLPWPGSHAEAVVRITAVATVAWIRARAPGAERGSPRTGTVANTVLTSCAVAARRRPRLMTTRWRCGPFKDPLVLQCLLGREAARYVPLQAPFKEGNKGDVGAMQ